MGWAGESGRAVAPPKPFVYKSTELFEWKMVKIIEIMRRLRDERVCVYDNKILLVSS